MAHVLVVQLLSSLLFPQYHCASLSSWESSIHTFPVSTKQAICGYNAVTQQLFIVGGSQNNKSLMTLDFACNQLTVHSPLSRSIECDGPCYAQYGEYLYFVEDQHVGLFNMSSHEIQYPISPTVTPWGYDTCLTISEDGRYLFIVGGRYGTSVGDPWGQFHIFDTQTGTINTGQRIPIYQCCYAPSCIIKNNILWWFGGFKRYPHSVTNYVLSLNISDIPNIASKSWVKHGARMTDIRQFQHSVVFNDYIYIISGDPDGKLVELFDDTLIQSTVDEALPVSATYQCAVSTDERIFVTVANNLYWSTAIGNTLKPTNYMTCDSTKQPTPRPTAAPTADTITPTADTAAPSEHPSADPTAKLREGKVVDITHAHTTDDEKDNEIVTQTDPKNAALSLVLLIIVIIFGILAILLCIFCYVVKKKNVAKPDLVEMVSMQTNPVANAMMQNIKACVVVDAQSQVAFESGEKEPAGTTEIVYDDSQSDRNPQIRTAGYQRNDDGECSNTQEAVGECMNMDDTQTEMVPHNTANGDGINETDSADYNNPNIADDEFIVQ